MRRNPLRNLKCALFALAAVAALGLAVMLLWNWTLPALFGVRAIEYLQAVEVLVLARVLFGTLRGGRGTCGHWRGRMMERWDQMTPEERTKFREGLAAGPCGFFGGDDAPETR